MLFHGDALLFEIGQDGGAAGALGPHHEYGALWAREKGEAGCARLPQFLFQLDGPRQVLFRRQAQQGQAFFVGHRKDRTGLPPGGVNGDAGARHLGVVGVRHHQWNAAPGHGRQAACVQHLGAEA